MAHAHDHDFFIPHNSIWPPMTCMGVGILAFGFILLQHAQPAAIGQITFVVGLLVLLYGMAMWFGNTISESRSRGFKKVPTVLDLGSRYGIIFFIVSEIMFFAAFFAAFFYLTAFNPEWPPSNIQTLPIDLPLINTLLLLTSGTTITWAHHALLHDNRKDAMLATKLTWILGILFLGCQMFEYSHASFAINSGAYGSTFYMLTGFHGFHVFVGTIMLMAVSARLAKGDFSSKHHFYFEAAAWYWHFVDVVWIGLFLFVYVLNG